MAQCSHGWLWASVKKEEPHEGPSLKDMGASGE